MLLEKSEEVRDLWFVLRTIIKNLRNFLDTENYGYVVEAYKAHTRIHSEDLSQNLWGWTDLVENLRSMYEKVTSNDMKLSTIEHGSLVQQAVYTISRANIMCVGLEFRLKRLKGG
ncbi:MAG: hypothetical protein NZ920_04325 [Aigarchaeota archaeon]|nr:hypothetical protein [Aigarchaeota archaeon]MDW8092153.1 hypothetical protein [Nitrososphaerota archaeon]